MDTFLSMVMQLLRLLLQLIIDILMLFVGFAQQILAMFR